MPNIAGSTEPAFAVLLTLYTRLCPFTMGGARPFTPYWLTVLCYHDTDTGTDMKKLKIF